MRGYFVFHKMNDDIRQKKLEINFAFFKDMNISIKNDAQYVIRGVFRRWWNKLPAEKKESELNRKMKKAMAGTANKKMRGLLG